MLSLRFNQRDDIESCSISQSNYVDTLQDLNEDEIIRNKDNITLQVIVSLSGEF